MLGSLASWEHIFLAKTMLEVKVSLPMSRTLCFAVCCRECQYFQYFSCSSRFLSSLKTTITTLCRGENHVYHFLFHVSGASHSLPFWKLYQRCVSVMLLLLLYKNPGKLSWVVCFALKWAYLKNDWEMRRAQREKESYLIFTMRYKQPDSQN